MHAGNCTSAKFVIDTAKAGRAGHYADQEIRIPPPAKRRNGTEGAGGGGREGIKRRTVVRDR